MVEICECFTETSQINAIFVPFACFVVKTPEHQLRASASPREKNSSKSIPKVFRFQYSVYSPIMIDLIQRHQQEIADICRRQGIQRLDVFGSAATGKFDAQSSDVDFIAEFDGSSPVGGL